MRSLLLAFLPCLLSAQATPGPARIQVFRTTAKAVRMGGTVTLSWSATGADQVRLEPLGLVLPARGQITHEVTGRTIYWLHVTNATGGQSVPLVVDLLPEEPAAPAGPPPQRPAVLPDIPRLADLPPVPALPPRRLARRRAHRRFWIQFAATASAPGAARLRRSLRRIAAVEPTLLVRRRHTGRPLKLIRTGPFPSAQAARLRLRELTPAMQALNLNPIILVGPGQPINPEDTYLAQYRQPR